LLNNLQNTTGDYFFAAPCTCVSTSSAVDYAQTATHHKQKTVVTC